MVDLDNYGEMTPLQKAVLEKGTGSTITVNVHSQEIGASRELMVRRDVTVGALIDVLFEADQDAQLISPRMVKGQTTLVRSRNSESLDPAATLRHYNIQPGEALEISEEIPPLPHNKTLPPRPPSPPSPPPDGHIWKWIALGLAAVLLLALSATAIIWVSSQGKSEPTPMSNPTVQLTSSPTASPIVPTVQSTPGPTVQLTSSPTVQPTPGDKGVGELIDDQNQLGGGPIVFTNLEDYNLHLYFFSTGKSVLLTDLPGVKRWANWSPDRRRVVFDNKKSDEKRQIYTINSDGTGLQQLTTQWENKEPSWSHDGSHIIFVSTRGGGQNIFIMEGDGSSIRQLTHKYGNLDHLRPAYSPNGRWIAFQANYNGQYGIHLITADGKYEKDLTGSQGDGNFSWSPDSTQIVFETVRNGNYDLYIVDVKESKLHQLTYGTADDVGPSWSWNGEKIVFFSNRGEPESDFPSKMWIINPDGTSPQKLEGVPGVDLPSWSPH